MPRSGIVVLDKPLGVSSFEAARAVGRALGVRRVGHGGTLDPQASGVLPVCVGEATKLAGYLLGGDKEYEATVLLGVATDTLDAEGRVTARRDAGAVDAEAVRAAMARFVGPQAQKPPMYSAIRQGGRRLYELARAGVEVERAPRSIEVRAFELLQFEAGSCATARVRVACSKGTYVRVLAADLGEALGTGAHLSALRRTRSGPFSLAQAVAPADVARCAPLPLSDALPGWPTMRLDGEGVRRVRNGQGIPAAPELCTAPPGTRVRLLSPEGELVALGELIAPGEPVRTHGETVARDEAGASPAVRPLRVFHSELTEKATSAIVPGN